MRVKIGDTWEVLLTNLPREHYSVDDLVHFYAMRWGEEVCFRDLKYTLGTLSFHSRLDKLITQEIWAKLLLYNLCAVLIDSAPSVLMDAAPDGEIPSRLCLLIEKGPGRAAVNFANAAHAIRIDFITRRKTPTQLANDIVKYKETIKPGQNEPRRRYPRRRFCLNYRAV